MDSLFLAVLLLLSIPCSTQDCRTASQKCADTYQCCGGCCIRGKCVETYRDCRLDFNPCEEQPCPPGYDCFIRQAPQDCTTCEDERVCKEEVAAPPTYPSETPHPSYVINVNVKVVPNFCLCFFVLNIIFL